MKQVVVAAVDSIFPNILLNVELLLVALGCGQSEIWFKRPGMGLDSDVRDSKEDENL